MPRRAHPRTTPAGLVRRAQRSLARAVAQINPHLWRGRRNRSSRDSATTRIKLQDLAVTAAALDAKTGRTLWTRPRSSVFCGQLSFDLAHPVVCDTGTVSADGTNATGLDVTVAGIDPATGKNRWQAHVGAVHGLVHGQRTRRASLAPPSATCSPTPSWTAPSTP